jgi:polysulfide reductase chain B
MTNALTFGEKILLRMQAEAKGKEVVKKLSAMSMTYVRTPPIEKSPGRAAGVTH